MRRWVIGVQSSIVVQTKSDTEQKKRKQSIGRLGFSFYGILNSDFYAGLKPFTAPAGAPQAINLLPEERKRLRRSAQVVVCGEQASYEGPGVQVGTHPSRGPLQGEGGDPGGPKKREQKNYKAFSKKI